jgi:hypothetical protein
LKFGVRGAEGLVYLGPTMHPDRSNPMAPAKMIACGFITALHYWL